jgi:hypothetical protein
MRNQLPAVLLSFAVLAAISGAPCLAQDPPPSSPTVGSANLAKDATVVVSSEMPRFPKEDLIDGNRTTEWASNDVHPWVKLQWKEPVKIGRLVICDRADAANKAQGGKLLFSDGRTIDVDDIAPGGVPHEVQFEPRTVTWLRFDLFSARGKNPGLAEIEVYSDGEAPKPAPIVYPAAGTLVTIPENDPRITTVDGVREGKWSGAMWCRFAGTAVRLFGRTGPDSGTADVYIDGLWQKTIDWYSVEPATDVKLFEAGNLADGKHLLGILTHGTKRVESKGTSIGWSRIEYVAGAHPEQFTPVPRTRFDSNVPLWLDDRGEPIQGHLGGIMAYEGRYYMVGQDWCSKRIPGFQFDWAKNEGMPVYSSPDLMNWTYHGKLSEPSSDPNHPLYNYAIAAGRGKLLRATGTGKFVALFMIVDNTFREVNTIAAAVADKPEGPYRWHGVMEIDGQPMQGADTAVFTDDDGKQYLITGKHADDWNVADCLYQLSPDCLHIEKAQVLKTGGEAPAIFKHDGVYYLLHSQLTGLQTNDNFYHTATNIWGPWEPKGKIAVGEHAHETFLTQTMDVVPVAGKKDAFLWIGDSLRDNAFPYTRTVWLPITLKGKGEMEIRWRDSWDLSVFDK